MWELRCAKPVCNSVQIVPQDIQEVLERIRRVAIWGGEHESQLFINAKRVFIVSCTVCRYATYTENPDVAAMACQFHSQIHQEKLFDVVRIY